MALLTNIDNKFSVSDAGAVRFNDAFTFPTADGTANYVLKTNGSGQLAWAADNNNGDITGSGTANTVTKFTGAKVIGNGPITFATNDSTFAGSITGTRAFFNSGTTNVVATFTSTDGTAGIGLIDSSGSVELSASGDNFQVQPAGGTAQLTVGSSASTFAGTLTATNYFSSTTGANIFLGSVITKPGDNLGFVIRNSSNTVIGSFLRTSNTASKLTTDNLSLGGTTAQYVRGDGSFATFSPGTGTVTGSGTANTMPVWTSASALGNSIITQPSSGNVRVSGSSVYFSVTDTSTAARNIDIGHWITGQTNIESVGGILSIGTQSNHDIIFETNGSTKATILANGNVGINNTSPGSKLTVNGNSNGSAEYTVTLGTPSGATGAANSANTSPVNKTLLTGYGIPYSGQTNARLTTCGFLEFASTAGWTGSQRTWAITSGYDIGGSDSGAGGNKMAIILGNGQNVSPQIGTNGAIGEAGDGDGANSLVACYWDNALNMRLANSSRLYTGAGGSAALPMITPGTDKNTGIWYPANDTWAVSTAGEERIRITSAGNVGIGIIPNSGYKLDIFDATEATFRIRTSNATGNGGVYIGNGDRNWAMLVRHSQAESFEIRDETANETRFKIDSSGKVSVGTCTGNLKEFNVKNQGSNGGLRIEHSGSANTVAFLGQGGSGDEGVLFLQDSGVDTVKIAGENGLDSFINSGKLGIGVTAPLALLHIEGPNNNDGNDYAQLYIKGTGTYPLDITGIVLDSAGSSQSHIRFSNNGTPKVQLRYNEGPNAVDKLGVYSFTLSANIAEFNNATGAFVVKNDVVAYGSPSDKRLKENIKPIKSALDKVIKLQGVTFDWKEKGITNLKEDIGFIAQDVQKVIPELVRENDNGVLSMRHQGIAPILLEAIKELKAEIEELKFNKCNCK